MYLSGILKIIKFDIPVISIGNLSFGGTGKSPHVEFVHNIISSKYNTGIVSRGFKRKSKGVKEVKITSSASEAGDEPLQFKKKFPGTAIAVSENRALGIGYLIREKAIDCVLLDDAFQHWGTEAKVKILLTTYAHPFFEDHVVPSGRLREFRKGYKRADIIIVSKCPTDLSESESKVFSNKIKATDKQQIFFSRYRYNTIYPLVQSTDKTSLINTEESEIILLTAIAETNYLEKYIRNKFKSYHHLKYADHHNFSLSDLKKIKTEAKDKLIITTEKDAVRLEEHLQYIMDNKLKIYVLPVEVKIAFGEQDKFENTLFELI